MFEGMTYEVILNDMLDRVTSDVDKREGSVIYDALAPCAYHLAQIYFGLDFWFDLVSGDTAVGEYLDRVVADYGLTPRKAATYAERKIITSGPVDIGTRWSINGTVYTITEILTTNRYKATCGQSGEIGNTYTGALENIDNVSGITATITDIITPGQEEESDENLRARYLLKLQQPATSGNSNHYKQWALEVPGVGDAKIYPLWDGPGTVKVVIVDNDKQPTSSTLIEAAADHIEELRPIGAAVTVVSGTGKQINISASVILASGYSIQAVISAFTEAVTDYFKSIAFSITYVSIAKIGTILLSTDGVIDYSDLQLNNSISNIALAEEEIPVVGSVDMEV